MTNKTLTLGSLFDGSGGFPLGGLLASITPVWASEIEPFPIRVTTKRLPFMKHYGDISQMDGGKIEPVDIITFGSPCTDMSIAGRRAGLDGRQSSLFYEAIRIIKEMRCATDGKYPRWICWENVPGSYSSNKGKDFQSVLEAVIGIAEPNAQVPMPEKARWPYADLYMGDGWSVAYRTLDAQYWGVPQRRRRIYLVADLAGESAGKILFESEGLSGYSKTCISSWKGAAAASKKSTGDAGIGLMFENHGQDCRYKGPLDVSQTVLSTYGTGGNNQPFVVETPKTLKIRSGCEGGGKGALIQDNKSATLGTNNDQTLFQPVAYGICSKDSNSMKSANPNSGFYEADTSRTIDSNGGNPSCNQGGITVIEGNGTRPSHKGDGYKESDVMYTLNATEQHAVAYGIGRPAMNQGYNAKFSFQIEEEVEPTIVAAGASGVAHPVYSSSKASFFTSAEEEMANTLVATDYKDPPIVNEPRYIVRRLTPTECARLQGFPDWWCDELGTENPTNEDISIWREIFQTHTDALGKKTKPKTDNQIRKWLKNPHSDSAEYKMWGNGVALPNVVFVLSGIAYYAQNHDG